MKYKGYLISKDGIKYTTEILTNAQSGTWEQASHPIRLAKDGIVTMVESERDVFRPLKLGGATISITGKEYLFDIFSAKPNGTAVRILRENGEIDWCGYAQPCMYNQEWSNIVTDFEIECNDCLAILRDVEFSSINSTGMSSVADYLQKAVDIVAGGIFPLTLKICEPFNDVKLSDIIVQESNWTDEGGEVDKWTDVLESILQYLGLQIVQCGTEIRVYKVKALLSGSGGNFFGGKIEAFDNLKCEVAPSISLTDVYKKIKATVSLYSQNEVFPDFFDEGCKFAGSSSLVFKPNATTYERYFTFLENESVKTFAYNKSSMAAVAHAQNVVAMRDNIGAWLVKSRIDKYEGNNTNRLVNSLSSDDYLVIARHARSSGNQDSAYSTRFPMVTIKQKTPIVFGGNYGFLISCGANYTPEENPIFRPDNKPKSPEGWQITIALICKLRVGNKWCNPAYNLENKPYEDGVSVWQEEESTFVVYLAPDNDLRYEFSIPIFADLSARNNVSWESGISERGFFIPIYAADSLAGDVEFTIMGINDPSEGINKHALVEFLWLKDLSIKIVKEGWYTDGDIDDDDIEYENVIDKANATELGDFKLKVATDVGRDFSRGSAILKTDNSIKFLKEVTDAVSGVKAICEHHLIDGYYRQNCEPRRDIECTLLDKIVLPTQVYNSVEQGVKFVVNGVTNHFEDGTSEINLIEIA